MISDLNSLNSEIKDFHCMNPRTCHRMVSFPASGWLIGNTEFLLRKTLASHSSGYFSHKGMKQLQIIWILTFLNIPSYFMTFVNVRCLRACKHHASPKSHLYLISPVTFHNIWLSWKQFPYCVSVYQRAPTRCSQRNHFLCIIVSRYLFPLGSQIKATSWFEYHAGEDGVRCNFFLHLYG